MNDSAKASPFAATGFSGVDRQLRRRLLQQLQGLRESCLRFDDALGSADLGIAAQDGEQTLCTRMRVHDPAFYRAVAGNGSVGAGEAYMDGLWDCDDLVTLVRMLVRNRDLLDRLESGLARIGGLAMRSWNALRRNTYAGSRRNIAAHYDLGNAFFRLFLSDDLMYSSALFASPDDSLERASERKLERICRKLALKPGEHVLEIGSGWGGFALYAARHYGCRITTTTISREQYDLARERIHAAGLSDRIELRNDDYRDLRGEYDKLVSIEMIEAIGHQYLDTYAARIGRLLKPDGLALIQAITIEDQRYAQALASVDFIKRYIFPGSFIPCVSAIVTSLARHSDLRVVDLEDMGNSYALTVKAWRERFLTQLTQVRAQGYDERFIRMWEFYLAYCEGGFREHSTSAVQLLLAKPRNRRESYLPDPPP